MDESQNGTQKKQIGSSLFYVLSICFGILYVLLYEHVRNYISILGFSTNVSYLICVIVFIFAAGLAFVGQFFSHTRLFGVILMVVLIVIGVGGLSGHYLQFPDHSIPAWQASAGDRSLRLK